MAITGTLEDLTLRQLQYAVAVADTLGFRRAAVRCAVSQPALSAQIQHLEGVLGVTLFERDRRRVLVTPVGRAVVEHARRVLVQTEDLLSAARRLGDPFAGTFRLAVIPTVAPYLLPEVTAVLGSAYPRLRLVLREEKTEDAVREVAAGRLDAALLALEADLGGLEHAEILRDPFFVAMSRAHALAKRKRIAQTDLEDQEVLLLDDGHCLRAQALALCAKAGAHETDVRATSLATLVQMVALGPALTLLPKLAVSVENRRAQLEIRPFLGPAPFRTIGLAWRASSPLGGALREIAATLRPRLRDPGSRLATHERPPG